MLEELLAKIEAAEKKATPAPWPYIEKTSDGKRIIIDSHLDGTWERMTCEVSSDDCCSDTAMASAEFIALSRFAVPVLCRLVRAYKDWASEIEMLCEEQSLQQLKDALANAMKEGNDESA